MLRTQWVGHAQIKKPGDPSPNSTVRMLLCFFCSQASIIAVFVSAAYSSCCLADVNAWWQFIQHLQQQQQKQADQCQ
jgi:hypothetical protein